MEIGLKPTLSNTYRYISNNKDRNIAESNILEKIALRAGYKPTAITLDNTGASLSGDKFSTSAQYVKRNIRI